MGFNIVDTNVFYSTFTNVFVIFVTFFYVFNVLKVFLNVFFTSMVRGVNPYGTGGTRPPQYLDRGGHDHECPPPIFLE